jgi:hypothetical protein
MHGSARRPVRKLARRGRWSHDVAVAAMPKKKHRTPGPKPRGGETSKPVTLRATDTERATWEAAAAKEGLKLSDWLRAAAELAIARGSTR